MFLDFFLYLIDSKKKVVLENQQFGSAVDSPLGAVGVARVAFVVGLGVLEDEAAGTLQAVRTLFHAVGAIFEVEALYAVLGALRISRKKTHHFFFSSVRHGGRVVAAAVVLANGMPTHNQQHECHFKST